MNAIRKVYNLIILDESGSMAVIRDHIICAFNAIVMSTKSLAAEFQDQEHFVTLVTFNSEGFKTFLHNAPLKDFDVISGQNYRPDACTPLYDAMGFSINRLRDELSGSSDYNVLVNVLTDGLENASSQFSGSDIRKLVRELEETGKWTFVYTGADHDVMKAAHDMSIRNYSRFDKSLAGIHILADAELHARRRFMQKVRDKKDLKGDYFN